MAAKRLNKVTHITNYLTYNEESVCGNEYFNDGSTDSESLEENDTISNATSDAKCTPNAIKHNKF